MLHRSGVLEGPALPGMRAVVSIDERGELVEQYTARTELFDESIIDAMRARLHAWNRRALALLR